MAFQNYKTTNNAQAQLLAGISASAGTVILQSGQGSLFPSSFPFLAKLEKYDTEGRVIKREEVKVTAGADDTFTIVRSFGYCPASYSATTQTNTAFSFDSDDTFSLTITAEQLKDVQDEITRLETDKLNKSGWSMTWALLQAQGTVISSASTVDLSSATGNSLTVTGTTAITSFGTVQAGAYFCLTFTGALILTHNATSLILPTSANITTEVGDNIELVSLGGGNWKCIAYNRQSGQPIGAITATIAWEVRMWAGMSAPTGFLLCDGTAVSRTTYANLFSILNPTLGTFTVTVASPAVATLTSHGLQTGDSVYLTTTGALPTGLAQNTRYWVIRNDANAFGLATSLANALAGTRISTSGTQSGTHTARLTPYGIGDGSTTFNLPDFKGKIGVGKNTAETEFAGLGQTGGAKTHTLTINEIPAHNHNASKITSGQSSYGGTSPSANWYAAADSQGGGQGHNNIQPYVTLNYIIAF